MKNRWLIALLFVISTAIPIFAQNTNELAPVQATDSQWVTENNVVPNAVITPRRSPLAYGFVLGPGTKASGTSNWTVAWDATNKWYRIQITGVSYYFANFSTVVTTAIPKRTTCNTDSVNGFLLVQCYTPGGVKTQAYFGFGTF